MVNGISNTPGYAPNLYAQVNTDTVDPAIKEIKAGIDAKMAERLTTDQVNFMGQNTANPVKEEESGLPWGKLAAGAAVIGGAVFAYKKGGIGNAWKSIKGLWSKAPVKPTIKRDSSKFKHLNVNPAKVSKETIHVPAGRTLSVDKNGNYILKKPSLKNQAGKAENDVVQQQNAASLENNGNANTDIGTQAKQVAKVNQEEMPNIKVLDQSSRADGATMVKYLDESGNICTKVISQNSTGKILGNPKVLSQVQGNNGIFTKFIDEFGNDSTMLKAKNIQNKSTDYTNNLFNNFGILVD